MNPTRVSQECKDLAAKIGKARIFNNTPLLHVPNNTLLSKEYDVSQTLDYIFVNGDIRMPFESFRACTDNHWAWSAALSDNACGLVTVCTVLGRKGLAFITSAKGQPLMMHMSHDASTGTYCKVFMMYVNNDWKTMPKDPGNFMWNVMSLVIAVIWAHTSPVLQQVEASPIVTNGKSVEWKQARTYYTVITRKHAANNRSVKTGSMVSADARSLVAHARRAHMRILRAARYGSNQGKVLYIKNTWVGPKEWKDAESRQIYRIVK